MAGVIEKVQSVVSPKPTNYVRWDDPAVEPPIEDEGQKVQELMAIISELAQKHFSTHRHATRVTHVKTQAIVKGTLTVAQDLPEVYAQGLFKHGNPTSYPVALRFANEPIFLQDDRAPGPRGVGMKIFDVHGEFLDAMGKESKTHDMTFNNAPILELTDLPTTVEIFHLRNKYYNDHDQLKKELKRRKDASLQLAPQQLPNHHFMAYTMYSQSSYRWGDYIAKFALFPTTELQKKLATQYKIEDASDPEQHSKWIKEFCINHDAEFDLRAQLCTNLKDQPVEDCSVAWDESKFPYKTVGHVHLPKGQDVFDPARRVFWDDGMRLNPWYGLVEHQPLGSVNRLRKQIYQTSLHSRGELNARKPKNISNIDEIP